MEFRFVEAERIEIVELMQRAFDGCKRYDRIGRAEQDALAELAVPGAEGPGKSLIKFQGEIGLQ